MTVSHFCVHSDSKAHRKKATPRRIKKKKQEVSDVVAIKANRKIVNFLDVTLFDSAKCKQQKRISLKRSMQTVFSRDFNVHLLLYHKINQKTMLTPSSPETWRMIIRQQQEERKILSQRTNLRATKQQALTISCNPQRNSTRPNLRPFHNNISECPFKGHTALNNVKILLNHFKKRSSQEACNCSPYCKQN